MEKRRPPQMQTEITSSPLGDNIYDIAGPPAGFHCYLVVGEDKALLIDTGMGIGSLKKEIANITDLPVQVICTHGHPDHVGGTGEFDAFMLWEADNDVCSEMGTQEFRAVDVSHMPNGENFIKVLQPTGPAPTPVEDGQMINLGGRKLRIITAPGHTHGSICIYDESTGALFTGDNVQGEETALREWNASSLEEYIETLQKLKTFAPKVLYGGHRPNVISPENIDKYIACASDVIGGAEGEEHKMRFGGSCLAYEKDGVRICYTKENIHRK